MKGTLEQISIQGITGPQQRPGQMPGVRPGVRPEVRPGIRPGNRVDINSIGNIAISGISKIDVTPKAPSRKVIETALKTATVQVRKDDRTEQSLRSNTVKHLHPFTFDHSKKYFLYYGLVACFLWTRIY